MIEGLCDCGAVRWQLDREPTEATSCNCTLCRRYGALWEYDYEGEAVRTAGETRAYVRGKGWLEFHFCAVCACVVFWRARQADPDGRKRVGVNLRLADPDAVAQLPVHRFDGLGKFESLPRNGRCVADLWF
jgi:hypothetical protein